MKARALVVLFSLAVVRWVVRRNRPVSLRRIARDEGITYLSTIRR